MIGNRMMTVRRKKSAKPSAMVFTIGHSTRSIDEFFHLLKVHGVSRLVDIRTIPRSRHNPQFNRETLSVFLRNRRINYRHMKALGGFRHARIDSVNLGWHNASFRGFADYMQTLEFEEALKKLIDLAVQKRTTIMCAEAVPWRCHRSLISDALTARGIEVHDILSDADARLHTMTPMARIRGGKVIYPESQKKKALDG